MKQEYIDKICDALVHTLNSVVDAKSGAPRRVTFIFDYPNSIVTGCYDIQCGDKEVNYES